MQNRIEAPCWYALSAKPRHEKAVSHHLEIQKLESFLPLSFTWRTWCDRKKEVELPLFSGYVFCRFGYGAFQQLRRDGPDARIEDL